MKPPLSNSLLPLFVSLFLFGCGGGSGGESSSPTVEGAASPAPNFTVSATASSGGTLDPAAQVVAQNETATFVVSAEPGHQVVAVSGCAGSLLGDIYTTGRITASCTVTATFDKRSFTVTATAGEGGQITPGHATIAFGETTSFTLSPEPGFEIAQVSGCGGSLNGNEFITASISQDCGIDASFQPILYSIGGSATGLIGPLELLYRYEGGSEILALNTNGNFIFAQGAPLGASYQVTLNTAPVGQQCSITNGTGTVEENISDILVACEALASSYAISGTITPVASVTPDSDVNDLSARYADNSVTSQAQLLGHLAHVHGFASAEGTGGDSAFERFALSADLDDIFQVTLEAGQVIQLQVVDYKSVEEGGNAADLDLYLFDANYQLVGASEGITEFEELVAPASQVYFINVHAYAAASKYVLRLLPATTASVEVATPPDFVPNEMIVKYVDDSTSVDAAGSSPGRSSRSRRPGLEPVDLAQLRPGRAMAEMKRMNQRAFEKVATLRRIKRKAQQPDVVYAEPNYLRKSLLAPNDPHFALQWHYAAIGLPVAWETTTGGAVDQSVVVAVVDTGVVLAHPDMTGQLIGGYDFISNAERARDGDGIDTNPNDPGDSELLGESSWHGTHVAGTVAAASNNGAGVAGVSWGAKIMPLRVLGKDGGTSYDIIQSLRYAAGLPNDSGTVPARRADIANLSFGGNYSSLAEQEAYRAVRAAGVILVAAAGNAGSSEPLYPAAYPEVISVSATDYANNLAPYSSFGTTVALSAPGGNNAADLNYDGRPDGVLSTAVDDSNGTLNYVYRFYNGTSMAAPHVAGVLALMKAVHPALTPDDVDALIKNGSLSDDLGVEGKDDSHGYGFINAVKAVDAATDLALGGQVPVDTSPQVVSSPSRVAMGFGANAEITLSSEGGGDPVVASFSDNAEWLTVHAGLVDTNGLGSYVLSVDRSDLVDGSYSGDVVFLLDSGATLTVPVSMEVDTVSSAGRLTQLYALLVDSETHAIATATSTVLQADGSVSYMFAEVPAGTYYVVAGSDIDADGMVCQLGEVCGAYPQLTEPQVISLRESSLTGIDFTAQILHSFDSAASLVQSLPRQ